MPAAHPVHSAPALPPRWVRVVHWINASAFMAMFFSGWQIYNADPFWIDGLPDALALGGSLPGALQWHFAVMWVLVCNGAVAMLLLVASGRLRRLYLSLEPRALPAEIRRFLARPLEHEEGRRNAVQKLAYLCVLLLLAMEIASGLAMWKPVQLHRLADLLGGYEMARRIHFSGMALLGGFVAGHIVLALLSPRLLAAMFGIGAKPVPKDSP